jgi:TolA-binding protein
MLRIVSALIILTLMFGPSKASASDGMPHPAELLLQGRGLLLVDGRFVLDESQAIRVYRETDPLVAAFSQSIVDRNAMLINDAQLGDARAAVAGLGSANASLRNAQNAIANRYDGLPRYRWSLHDKQAWGGLNRQLIANAESIAAINDVIRQCEARLPSRERRQRVEADFDRHQYQCRDGVAALASVMDPLAASYRALHADEEVKEALKSLNARGDRIRLGPSEQFAVAYRRLAQTRKALGQPKPLVSDEDRAVAPVAAAEPDNMHAATRRIAIARALESTNQDAAIKRYRAVVAEHPGTPQAEEAGRRIESRGGPRP